jgi:protein SCO1/2
MNILKITRLLLLIIPGLFLLVSCDSGKKKLPILGERDWTTRIVDGKEVVDTIYNTIPAFKFVNQNGDTITEKNTSGKIYIADFFFTTCPTICPVMKRQMVKVYQEFKDNPDVMIISHTIDPDHDTPKVLIDEIGERSYMSAAREDSTAEGGFIHSGAFVLVDKEKHVRGMYDGTTEEGTERLISDIKTLLEEYKQ